MDDLNGAVGKGVQPPDGTTECDWKLAVMLAYGHLWHINNEPAAPIALYDPERAAYQARRHLRDLLTTQERGEAINQVGFLIDRYEATSEAVCAEPSMSTTTDGSLSSGSGASGEGVQAPDGDTEREGFERWFLDYCGTGPQDAVFDQPAAFWLERTDGEYEMTRVRDAWTGWIGRAAAAAVRQQTSEPNDPKHSTSIEGGAKP